MPRRDQRHRPGLVGLHDAGSRPDRRGRTPRPRDLLRLSRPGFKVVFYDTLEEFYLAEALEYIDAWRQSTADNPVGICGPIGPTEQLPLVARLVNALDLDVRRALLGHGRVVRRRRPAREVPVTHPLSFERADRELCFNRIRQAAAHAGREPAFSEGRHGAYRRSWDAGVRCAVMQGGQGDVKHWAFNDPAAAQGQTQGRAAGRRRISQADHARGRSASR